MAYTGEAGGHWSLARVDTAGSDGSYELTGLSPGDYWLEFTPSDGVHLSEYFDDAPTRAAATRVSVGPSERVMGVDAGLSRGGTISGRVTSRDGAAVAGVLVKVHGYDADTNSWVQRNGTFTDQNGSYTVAGIRAGTYRLGFSDPAGVHLPEFFDDAATFETATSVQVGPSQDVTGTDVVLARSATISGRVTSEADGAPLSFVIATVHRNDTDTGRWVPVADGYGDANGHYAVTGLPPGVYRVEFRHAWGDYLPEFFDDAATLASATDVRVDEGAEVTGVDAALNTGGSISGRVTSQVTGQPVGSVEVSLHSYDSQSGTWQQLDSRSTDSAGVYALTHVRPGTYRIGFRDRGDHHLPEFYDDAATLETARDVVVPAGGSVGSIDAALAERQVGGGPPYANISPPVISGVAMAGETLSARSGAWTPEPDSFTWEWLADGVSLGPGSATLVLTQAHVGKRISVRVTAHGAGRTSASATSSATRAVVAAEGVPPAPPVGPPAPVVVKNLVAPRIAGKARVGRKLKVRLGRWSPSSGLTFRIQWFVGRKKIRKATRMSLKVTRKLKGKKVSVRVKAVLQGAVPVTARSKSVKVT